MVLTLAFCERGLLASLSNISYPCFFGPAARRAASSLDLPPPSEAILEGHLGRLSLASLALALSRAMPQV